jgi:adenylate cyclase
MKLRMTIGLKLILITALLIGLVVSFVTYKNTQIFERVSVDKEEASNITMSESKSLTIELLIQKYVQKTTEIINQYKMNDSQLVNLNDHEFINIKIVEWQNGSRKENLITNPTNSTKILESFFEAKIQKNKTFIPELSKGKIILFNNTLDEKNINFILSFVLENKESNSKFFVWSLIKSNEILKVLNSNTNQQFYMFDKNNELMFSSEQKSIVFGNIDLGYLLFNTNNKTRVEQKYLNDKKKNSWLVTSVKNSYDMHLFSKVQKEAIFAPSDFMKQNSYYILGMVLSIVIILVHLVAQLISNPIEELSTMAEKVGTGDLTVRATDKIKTSDEVGDLAKSFDQMVVGLKERDKMKNLFTKFHGTAVTQELLQSEISLGGKRKEVTVFFSDIRGFTDFSEGHTPEEVVSMLNEYFEVMVKIINDNGGVVDKFIGDAIMAVWGVPNTSQDDTKNAIIACLEMRMALNSLNQDRILRKLTPIKIGMGLHAGEAISGQIGSSERMEFTVIGDAVNTASRIEGSTKSFGTDLLISKECLAKIEESNFLFEKAGEAKVQGKTENLVLYKVNGIVVNGEKKILETPYSAFEAVEDKKSKKAS